MTRKDYVLIAAAFHPAMKAWYGQYEMYAVEDVLVAIADALGADNPRFDRTKFLKAARGIEL